MKQNLLFSGHAGSFVRMAFVGILLLAFSPLAHAQNIKTITPEANMSVASYSTAEWSYTPEGELKMLLEPTSSMKNLFNSVNEGLVPGFQGATYLKYNFDVHYDASVGNAAFCYFMLQFPLAEGVSGSADVNYSGRSGKVSIKANNYDKEKGDYNYGEQVTVEKASFTLVLEYTVESANSFTTKIFVDGDVVDSYLTTLEGEFGTVSPNFNFNTMSYSAATAGDSYLLFKGIDYVPGPVVGVDDSSIAGVKAYSAQNRVYIQNEGDAVLQSAEILDLTGQVVYSGEATPVIDTNVAAGYYLVRLVSADGAASSFKVYLTK